MCLIYLVLYSEKSFWGERHVHCPEFRGNPLLGGCQCIIGIGISTGTLSAVGSVSALRGSTV